MRTCVKAIVAATMTFGLTACGSGSASKSDDENLGPRIQERGAGRLTLAEAMQQARARHQSGIGNPQRPIPGARYSGLSENPYGSSSLQGANTSASDEDPVPQPAERADDDLSGIRTPSDVRNMLSQSDYSRTRLFPDQMICRAITSVFTRLHPSEIGQESRQSWFDMKYRLRDGTDGYARCIIHPERDSHIALMYFWQPNGRWSPRQLAVYLEKDAEMRVATWDDDRTYVASYTRPEFTVR
jgi:hypothetical protein